MMLIRFHTNVDGQTLYKLIAGQLLLTPLLTDKINGIYKGKDYWGSNSMFPSPNNGSGLGSRVFKQCRDEEVKGDLW